MEPLILDYVTQLHDLTEQLMKTLAADIEGKKTLGPTVAAGIMAQLAGAHVGLTSAVHRYVAATDPEADNGCNHG